MKDMCLCQTLGYPSCNVQCSDCYYYQSGLEEPHYPVPAIQTVVVYGGVFWSIWVKRGYGWIRVWHNK